MWAMVEEEGREDSEIFRLPYLATMVIVESPLMGVVLIYSVMMGRCVWMDIMFVCRRMEVISAAVLCSSCHLTWSSLVVLYV